MNLVMIGEERLAWSNLLRKEKTFKAVSWPCVSVLGSCAGHHQAVSANLFLDLSHSAGPMWLLTRECHLCTGGLCVQPHIHDLRWRARALHGRCTTGHLQGVNVQALPWGCAGLQGFPGLDNGHAARAQRQASAQLSTAAVQGCELDNARPSQLRDGCCTPGALTHCPETGRNGTERGLREDDI